MYDFTRKNRYVIARQGETDFRTLGQRHTHRQLIFVMAASCQYLFILPWVEKVILVKDFSKPCNVSIRNRWATGLSFFIQTIFPSHPSRLRLLQCPDTLYLNVSNREEGIRLHQFTNTVPSFTHYDRQRSPDVLWP